MEVATIHRSHTVKLIKEELMYTEWNVKKNVLINLQYTFCEPSFTYTVIPFVYIFNC